MKNHVLQYYLEIGIYLNSTCQLFTSNPVGPPENIFLNCIGT